LERNQLKAFLLLVFGGLAIYTYLSFFSFATEQKEKLEVIAESNKLIDKIKIPNGMEKEYYLILADKDPYTGKQNPTALKKSNTIGNEKNAGTTTFGSVKEKKEIASIDVTNTQIIGKNVVADIEVTNILNIAFSNFEISCTVLDANGDPISTKKITIEQTLAPGNTYLRKQEKFAINSKDPESIDCNVN
jgi:hypothetical protein